MEVNKKERFMVRFYMGPCVLTCKVLRPVIFKVGEVAKMKCIDTISTEIPAIIVVRELNTIKSNIIKKLKKKYSCQVVDITGVF